MFGRVSALYITIYTFLEQILIIFYVPFIQGNRMVIIRTSYDISKNILTQEKDPVSVSSKSCVDEAQIYAAILSFFDEVFNFREV